MSNGNKETLRISMENTLLKQHLNREILIRKSTEKKLTLAMQDLKQERAHRERLEEEYQALVEFVRVKLF